MLAAEQGAGDNTLDAYRRDLDDFSEFLGRSKSDFTGADTQTLRDYLADLDQRGFKSTSVARRLSAMRHLFRFLLSERIAQRRSGGDPVGPEARPRPAEGAVDRRRRPLADARASELADAAEASRAAAAARAAAVLPARGALRHRPARLRTGGAAAVRGAARCPHDRGARQGQQGTAGAAERRLAAGDGGLPRRDRSAESRRRRKTPPPRNGCFRRSAKAAI